MGKRDGRLISRLETVGSQSRAVLDKREEWSKRQHEFTVDRLGSDPAGLLTVLKLRDRLGKALGPLPNGHLGTGGISLCATARNTFHFVLHHGLYLVALWRLLQKLIDTFRK